MVQFLVETALLSHGLPSISDAELQKAWTFAEQNLVWVEQGEVIIGGMAQYLGFRNQPANALRIDCDLLPTALEQGLTGALTASGTMAVCQKLGLKLAVTCGMGGIGEIKEERLCPDLPALAEIPVTLLSAGPKDMLDVQATMAWLKSHLVVVASLKQPRYGGYIFKSCDIALNQVEIANFRLGASLKCLLLNPIPEARQIADLEILQLGIAAGKRAEQQGKYYHPAANGEFDRLTKGESSRIQLEALISNVKLAQTLVKSI